MEEEIWHPLTDHLGSTQIEGISYEMYVQTNQAIITQGPNVHPLHMNVNHIIGPNFKPVEFITLPKEQSRGAFTVLYNHFFLGSQPLVTFTFNPDVPSLPDNQVYIRHEYYCDDGTSYSEESLAYTHELPFHYFGGQSLDRTDGKGRLTVELDMVILAGGLELSAELGGVELGVAVGDQYKVAGYSGTIVDTEHGFTGVNSKNFVLWPFTRDAGETHFGGAVGVVGTRSIYDNNSKTLRQEANAGLFSVVTNEHGEETYKFSIGCKPDCRI